MKQTVRAPTGALRVNSQALGGGCALALCCDYRIQSEKGTLGLNEVALGIPVPKYWCGSTDRLNTLILFATIVS
jgi:enoyl-CoA hydratase/carnithine racemase